MPPEISWWTGRRPMSSTPATCSGKRSTSDASRNTFTTRPTNGWGWWNAAAGTAAGYDREEPARFTGHERDFNAGTTSENANYNDYMHARYAVPQWGRFLSVDPTMDLKKAAHEPQMWNRYAYVTNNPLRYTDPDGRYRDGGYLERDPNKPLDYCCAEG